MLFMPVIVAFYLLYQGSVQRCITKVIFSFLFENRGHSSINAIYVV